MKVTLLSYTPDPQEVCATAASTCYSALPPEEIHEGNWGDRSDYLKKIINSGHTSILEHATFTFAISGISRVTSHQLVRHRMASYEQQSDRYVKMTFPKYVCPPSVKEDRQMMMLTENLLDLCTDTYNMLVEAGIPPEDARYYLPNGLCTNIVVTMNARELRHFFSLRCCNRAQWEIREMADKMLELCKEVAPAIFFNAGPGCVRGKCPEGKMCCGHPRNKE